MRTLLGIVVILLGIQTAFADPSAPSPAPNICANGEGGVMLGQGAMAAILAIQGLSPDPAARQQNNQRWTNANQSRITAVLFKEADVGHGPTLRAYRKELIQQNPSLANDPRFTIEAIVARLNAGKKSVADCTRALTWVQNPVADLNQSSSQGGPSVTTYKFQFRPAAIDADVSRDPNAAQAK